MGVCCCCHSLSENPQCDDLRVIRVVGVRAHNLTVLLVRKGNVFSLLLVALDCVLIAGQRRR